MDQMTLFECFYEKYKITKPIRLIELFAGYGSQALALKYLGVKFEHWHICEWATKSIQAYNDLHIRDYKDYSKELTQNEVIDKLASYGVSMNYNEPMTYEQIKRKGEDWQRKTYNNIIATHNLVNIQNAKAIDFNIVDTDKYEYILTYSFPCQDLSLAGKGKGMSRDSGTRSGMLWEVERILDECKEKPQILLMENVTQVIGSKNMKDFQEWTTKLESLGYSNYVKCLNSKDYGVPQNRNRCFMISILGEHMYKFPQPFLLKLILKDLLESNVDEKYYLSDKMINYISFTGTKNFKNPDCKINLEIGRPLTTDQNKRAGTTNYICDKLPENFDLGLMIKEATQKGYAEAHEGDGVYINRPHQKRGVVQKGMIQTIKTSPDIGVVVESQYSEYSLNKIKENIVQDDVVGTITASAMQSFNHDNCHLLVEENRLTSIEQLLLDIFDLCCIIDTKEKDKYERSRELLQILWEEIGKEEIWQEIRRFISIQEKKILQSNLYENELYEDRKPQSKISTSTSNSSEYNESITNREKMFNMWEKWKTRYTPQRWELSKQQFRQFNLFMQKLPYETTQGETSMQDMWQTNERFRLLQQTLFKIQEIWRPYENKISNGLRIRKLTSREAFRLMGVKDEDFDKIKENQSDSSLYHLAGDSIVTTCLMALFGELLGIDYITKITELMERLNENL